MIASLLDKCGNYVLQLSYIRDKSFKFGSERQFAIEGADVEHIGGVVQGTSSKILTTFVPARHFNAFKQHHYPSS